MRSAVIIGNGNVALDVARILAKHGDELKGSDLPPDVLAALRSQPIKDIHIVGRRGAAEAKFSPTELKEIGTLQRAKAMVEDPNGASGDTPVEQVLLEFATDQRTQLPVTIHFHFGLTPMSFIGCNKRREEGREIYVSSARPRSCPDAEFREADSRNMFDQDTRLQSIRVRSSSGDEVEIPAQLAVTCIGYEAVPCCTASPSNGTFANDGGRIGDGLYVVGWAKRGPSGTIPTNRAEALQVAQKIASEVTAAPERSAVDLTELLQSRGVVWIDYAGWKRIEEAERAGACDERCRLKLLRTEDMLRIARQTDLELKSD